MAEKKIGNRTFKTEPVLATQALLLQARVFRILGPGLARFGDIMRARTEGNEGTGAAIVAAFAEVFTKADPAEVVNMLSDVIGMAQIKRPSGIYENCDMDGDFTGHQKDVYPVALFVLKEQLGDFFTGLPEVGSLAKLKAAVA